jgi:hypothetical protein
MWEGRGAVDITIGCSKYSPSSSFSLSNVKKGNIHFRREYSYVEMDEVSSGIRDCRI